jgi:hypothetical protein
MDHYTRWGIAGGWCSRIDLWNINVTNSNIDCLRLHRNYTREETPSAQQTHWFPCPIFYTPGAPPCRHDHNHDDLRRFFPCSRMHTIGLPSATSSTGRAIFFATVCSLWVPGTLSPEVYQAGREAELPREFRSRIPPRPHTCAPCRSEASFHGVVFN